MQVAASKKLTVHQMDVKTAYLNAEIDHEIYVKQPEGFEVRNKEGNALFCKLKKSLYGLKQSGRMWNNVIHLFFIENGFTQSKVDPCIYVKHDGKEMTLILLWVDDILIGSSSKTELTKIKNLFKNKFKMTDLGILKWFLGIGFTVTENSIEMNQSKYIHKVLERFVGCPYC